MILIHLHLFYIDMWKNLRPHIMLFNAYQYDLYITIPEIIFEQHSEIKAEILHDIPHAKIILVANQGFDIAPFLYILQQVDLCKYDYIAKLHSKRDMKKGHSIIVNSTSLKNYCVNTSEHRWRDYLLYPFANTNNLEDAINYLKKNKSVGMVASHELITRNIFGAEVQGVKDFLKKHNLPQLDYRFVAGTMFIVKAHLLKPLLALNLCQDDFMPSDTQRNMQLAHIIERILGYFIYHQGYEIADFNPKKKWVYFLASLFQRIKRFLFLHKETSSGKRIIKICKIPIWRSQMKP